MRWYKALFNAMGGMGGAYACIELARLIFTHWRNFSFHLGFILELFLLTFGLIWIIVALIDNLYIPSDLLGFGLKGKGLIGGKKKRSRKL